ncbi:MAG: ABC transporter substrate-binding protein [Bacilli bacterium]
MKKNIIIFITILFVIGTHFFVFKDSVTDKQKLTIAEVTHSVFYTPQYVALAKGFFEDEGLDVEIITTPGANNVTTAVLSKSADIGLSGLETVLYINSGDSKDKMKAFAGLTKKDGSFIITKEKHNNFTLNTLKGSHIIAGREGGMPALTFEYILNSNNIDINKDVNFDTSIAFDAMKGAFLSNVGNVVTMFEPSATNMKKEGSGYISASLGEFTKDMPYTVYYSTEKFIENNKSLLEKYTKAINKALKYTKETSNLELAKTIKKYFPDSKIDVIETSISRYKIIGIYRENVKINKEEIDLMYDVISNGMDLDEKLPYESLIYDKFFK